MATGDSGTRLTIAVLHYQTPAVLADCLARLRVAAPRARIVVCDAGDSAPLPADWILQHEGIELLRIANLGHSPAVNAALEGCDTEYFMHMNADVLVERDSIADLVAVLDSDPTLGMAGPVALDAQGRVQDQGLPYRFLHWRLRLGGNWRAVYGAGASEPAAGPIQGAAAARSRQIPWLRAAWLSGCMQLVRMSAVADVGPMDESLRFYNADVEWCLRLRARGWGNALVDSAVTHLGGTSTPARPEFLVEGLVGGYVVSRRYAPAWYAETQAFAVRGWAVLASVLAPGRNVRQAARAVKRIFRQRSFDEPVFGETMAGPAPGLFAATDERPR